MATVRVRMLTNATGPHLHCKAGCVYDLPKSIADDFLAVRSITTTDVVTVNGKETKSERVIGSVGPHCELAPDAERKEVRTWKRNPDKKDDE